MQYTSSTMRPMRVAASVAIGLVLPVALPMGGCSTLDGPPASQADARRAQAVQQITGQITELVDAWHRAAATGDLDAYFSRMTDDAVFLGTDDTERWDRDAFLAFARPYFDGPTTYGDGAWTYEPAERFVMVSDDARTAWFDERLDHERYGRCRGTGVCVRDAEGWRIAHYSLTFPVPNDVAGEVIGIIRAHEQRQTP